VPEVHECFDETLNVRLQLAKGGGELSELC
jgi:hypothetical protein